MRGKTIKLLAVLGGFVVGIVGFLGVLGFLVSDACMDSGGAVGGSWFVCVVKGGKELPWGAMVRPMMVATHDRRLTLWKGTIRHVA